MNTNSMSVLGLTSTEEDVYRHFLRNPGTPEGEAPGAASPGERESGVRAVGRLRELRLLHGDDTNTWAVDPVVAVPRLAGEQLDTAHRTMRQLVDVRPILRSLRHEGPVLGTGAPEDGAAALFRLEGLREVRARVGQLAFGARSEVLAADPCDASTPESAGYARHLDLGRLSKTVRVRVLVRATALADAGSLDRMRHLHLGGAAVRVADELSESVLVYDRHAALVPIDARDTGRGALYTEESGLVSSLVGLFERLWATATDFADLVAADTGQVARLTDTQRLVLAAMCAVSKDETGARQARMSLRTYRRHISDVLRLLGACNRAQAALLARERGWV
ncbi:helix-turn-helix transcriptional regulator [Streptomyces clavifer]|uniref:helix-turn-helix transcriptional regulator n=1 Tax=Streptomyces clavifer TaxID=68188 RepID=UPI0036D1D15E